MLCEGPESTKSTDSEICSECSNSCTCTGVQKPKLHTELALDISHFNVEKDSLAFSNDLREVTGNKICNTFFSLITSTHGIKSDDPFGLPAGALNAFVDVH